MTKISRENSAEAEQIQCELNSFPSNGTSAVADNDPWTSLDQNEHPADDEGVAAEACFDDNFSPTKEDAFEPLPDSEEYLKVLTNRLDKLKKKGSLVRDLQKRRQDEMKRFLDSELITAQENEQHLTVNPILRHIAPEYQALTEEEKIQLLTADSLQHKDNNGDNEQNQGSQVSDHSDGSKGFGQCCAVALSEVVGEGSRFLLTARTKEGLEETKSLLSPKVQTEVFTMDGAKPHEQEFKKFMALAAVDSSQYKSAVLIHNAGSVGKQGHQVRDLSHHDELRHYFDLNLLSVTMLTSTFLKHSDSIPNRFIVNITSLLALQPLVSWSLYCSGKAARDMLFKVLAAEEPELRVVSYAPGPLNTDMVKSTLDDPKTHATVKTMFRNMVKEDKLLTPMVSAEKLANLLVEDKFKSGDHVDFYDI